MDKLSRIITTAHQLAHANGVEHSSHVDQIIGAMMRKLSDGLQDADIYDIGRTVAKKLARIEQQNNSINALIESIKSYGNPLVAAHQAF